MGLNNFEERRRGVRAKRIITVRHRLHKRGRKTFKPVWHISTTEDMSISGLLFLSANEYEIDDILELQVVMSGALDIFNGFGRVARVVPEGRTYFHIGIEYTDLKSRGRSAKRVGEGSSKKK